MFDFAVGPVHQRDLVGDAKVEPVAHRVHRVLVFLEESVRAVEAHLERMRARHVGHRGAIGEVGHQRVVVDLAPAVDQVVALLGHRDQLRKEGLNRRVVERAALDAEVHVAPALEQMQADRLEQQLAG